MEKKKAVRFEKCTSRFIIVTLLVVALVIACPSFSLTTKAAESTAVWHVGDVTDMQLYYHDYGSNRSTITLNFDVNSLISTYSISDISGQLTVSYDAFTYTLDLGTRTSSSTVYVNRGYSLLGNVKLYIVDNLGNQYPLDPANGGSFTIEDTSNITSLSLYLLGNVSGTLPNTGTMYRYVRLLSRTPAFDITLSTSGESNTITDSEGTVWTVPEGVENPVVVASSGTVFKQLVDASDLMYMIDDFDRWHFASYTASTANLYDPDGIIYETIGVRSLQEGYSVPVFISAYNFDSFLYGSLPELPLEKLPDPTPTPDPTPEPGDKTEKFEELETVKTEFKSDSNPYNDLVGYSAEGEPKNNWFTTFDAETWTFDVWSSKRTMEAVDGKNDFYHAHFDENISYPLTVFTSPRAPYDGYCVVSFPKGFLFKEPENGTNVAEGAEYLTSWQIQTEIKPYLLVQGVRYEISDFPCQFSFQVYEEESFSFTIGYEAHIRSEVTGNVPAAIQWRCPFEITPYSVSVWFYSDDEELSQILDKLENFPGADKMDEDKANLDNAIKDYDNATDSIFDSATEGIDNFDIASGFDFNSGILSSLGFIGTIISSIIVAMGDFSFLYTIGVCLVIVSVIIGLFKYFGGGEDD